MCVCKSRVGRKRFVLEVNESAGKTRSQSGNNPHLLRLTKHVLDVCLPVPEMLCKEH